MIYQCLFLVGYPITHNETRTYRVY